MRSRLLSKGFPWKRHKRQIVLLSAPSPVISAAQSLASNAFVSQEGLDEPCHQSYRSLTTTSTKKSPHAKITRDKSGEHIKATQRLIQAPVGSFDNRVWNEAEWTMRYWNRQRTVESVYAALDLTDRFLNEFSFQMQNKQQQKAYKQLPAVLTTASLNFTLHNWQACSKELKSPQQIAKLPSPTNMLATVDYFRDYQHQQSQPAINGRLRPLQPSIESYSMILDAMAFSQLFILQSEYEVHQDDISKAAATDEYGNVGWHFTTTPAPVIAETLLNRLVQESEVNTHLRPSIITFNNVINAWARSRHPDAPQQAEELLRTIQSLSTIPGWKDLKPTTATYGSIIHTWANSNSPMAAERAEELVKEMVNDNIPVNGEIHLGVIKAWNSSMDPQAADRAMKRLEGMIAAYRTAREKQQGSAHDVADDLALLKPPMNCFLAVMNIYAKQGDPTGATAVLEQLEDLYETCGRDVDLCPDTAVFNCLLRAWSRSQSSDAYAQAEKLLQRQRELSETTGNVKLMPDTVSYNAVLHALSRSRDANALERAEKLFSAMEETPGNKPDLISYNVMLHLISKSQQHDAAERAEAMLRQMWDMHSSKVIDFMPDTTSYNTCIDAWKNRNDPHRAEALFQELQERYRQTGFGILKPTRISYGSLITAWGRSKHRGSAEKAQEIFDAMIAAGIRPTTIEYNSTIHAWASIGHVDKAESLLDSSLEDYTKGNKRAKPDVKTFSSLLNAIAKRKSPDPWSDAKHAEAVLMRMEELSEFLGMGVAPNSFSFNIVLDCFARCRKNEAAPKYAERILRHMQALGESGNRNLRPSVISYTTVMNCWLQSDSEETVDRVETLFDELKAQYEATGDKALKPSQFTYNALIGAYARDTRHANSLDMAMHHFNNMVENYERTQDLDLRPGPMHFSVIMSALSRRGMADEAEHFLKRILSMCREYYSSDGQKLEISSSFNGLIGAHARSTLPMSAERAEMTLRRMQDLGPDHEYITSPPNVFSYTSVMMAWSLVSDPESRKEAVTRCKDLMQEMLEHARNGNRSVLPNNFTFGTLLQVISRSDLPQKNEHAEQVVEIMKQNRIKPDSFVRKMLAACSM